MQGRRVEIRQVEPIRADAKLTLSQRFTVIQRLAARRATARPAAAVVARPAERARVQVRSPAGRSPASAAKTVGRRAGGGPAASERAVKDRAKAKREQEDAKARASKRTEARSKASKKGGQEGAAAGKPAKQTAAKPQDVEKDFDAYLKSAGRGGKAEELEMDAALAAYKASAPAAASE